NVTANISVNAQFSSAKNQYTVTFYDEDGTTELGTSTVDYGTSATAPGNPTKTNYIFLGWNLDYSFVEADMDVYPTFNLTALYEFVYNMMYYKDEYTEYIPSNQEVAEQICFIKSVLATDTDEDTMVIITNGIGVMNSFTIASKTEFENWFASISLTYGFTRQMMIDTIIRFLVIQVNQEVERFDISNWNDQIAFYQSELLLYEETQATIEAAALDYCALLPNEAHRIACANVFNAQVAQEDILIAFQNSVNNYASDYEDWDWSSWNQIQNYKYMSLYSAFVDYDAVAQSEYEQYLYEYMEYMSSSEYDMYMTKLNVYETMMIEYFTNIYPLRNSLNGVMDASEKYVINILMFEFTYPHQECSYNINETENEISRWERMMEEGIANHEFMIDLQVYLSDPVNLGKIKTLLESVYDAVEYTAQNMDDPTFTMLTALIETTTLNTIQNLFNGLISLESTGVTMADISEYIANVSSLMGLIGYTVDENDVNNFKDLAKDIIGVYVNSTDATILEKIAMISLFENAVDHYTEGLGVIFYELKDLLDSMDETKLTILMEQVDSIMSGDMGTSQYAMILNISILIDELLGSGEFDINAVLGYGVDLYFDITTEFMGDSTGAKTALQTIISDIIADAAAIKLYDFELLTAEQLETINDFFGNVTWIQQFITYGPENYLAIEPVGYTHDHFVQTVVSMFGDQMTEEKADAIILMLVDALGYADEKTTYFAILSIFQLSDDISSISSLEDIQGIYTNLDLLGFSKENIASIAAEIFIGYISFRIEEGIYGEQLVDIASEITDLEMQIANLTTLMGTEETAINDLIAFIHTNILVMDDPIEGIALGAESMMYQDIENQLTYEIVLNQIRSNNCDWWSEGDEENIQNLITLRDMYYFYNYGETPNEASRDGALAAYENIWVNLSSEQQEIYQPILEAWENCLSYRYGTFYPQLDQLSNPALGPLGMATREFMLTDGASLLNMKRNYNWEVDQLAWINDQLNWLNQMREQIISEQAQMQALYDYLANEGNNQLVHDVAIILMDEIDNLLLNADPGFVNLVIGLMKEEILPENLTAIEILGATQGLSSTLKLLLSTLDIEGTDAAKIILLAQGINAAIINSRTDIDQIQKDELVLIWDTGIEDWFDVLGPSVDVITTFLDALTETEIETILAEIGIISSLDGIDPDQDNLLRAIAIANIFTAVLADGSLDYDFVFSVGIQLYFDGKYDFSYDGTIDIGAKIIEIQTLIDDLVAQADVIDGYDPLNLLAGELEEINQFHLLIEELMLFFSTGPDGE
ncbi:MAG: InlB B-repeat-containing protein, partial [Candidatus Izemoplasmatales bacterium]|nr:InlB B-repeat-containing protein [Candidatus Izemoplasmatales bacterium]